MSNKFYIVAHFLCAEMNLHPCLHNISINNLTLIKMNEELKSYIEKYVEYFDLDAKLDEKQFSKEELEEIYARLDALDEECRNFTPRVKELISK